MARALGVPSLILGSIILLLCSLDIYRVLTRGWEQTVFGHGPVDVIWTAIIAIGSLLVADAIYLIGWNRKAR